MNARGAGFPLSQLKTVPAILDCGISAPVEKTTTAPVFRTFPRKSLMPGSMVIVYAVLGRQPRLGRTETSWRCQSTSGVPLRGEIRNNPCRDVAPDGRSLTTSSKRKIASFGFAEVAPLSGATSTSFGASVSTGPPGGTPGDAQFASVPTIIDAVATMKNDRRPISSRKATSPSP
jgi:hypothetical protein